MGVHRHLPPELPIWVDEGLIPEGALYGVTLALRDDADERRRRWRAHARRLLCAGDPDGYRGVAVGFLPVAEADPKAWERSERVVRELAGLEPEARPKRLRDFHALMATPAMFDLLTAEARKEIGESPDKSAGWLALAAEAQAELRRTGVPPSIVAERELRLAALEANVLRARGELPAAALAFEALSSDPRRLDVLSLAAHGDFWSQEASVRTARREFGASLRLLERAAIVFTALDAKRELARVLIKRGNLADHAGDRREALTHHEAAAKLVDRVLDPRLHWATQHNLADSLLALDRPIEAAELVAESHSAFEVCEDAVIRMRATWLDGLIAHARGDNSQAERALKAVVRDCLEQGRHYDGALARLDLARVYLATGRLPQVKRLARKLVADFAAREVDREAHRAAKLFFRAAAAQEVTLAGIAALRRYLALARLDPSYRYPPS